MWNSAKHKQGAIDGPKKWSYSWKKCAASNSFLTGKHNGGKNSQVTVMFRILIWRGLSQHIPVNKLHFLLIWRLCVKRSGAACLASCVWKGRKRISVKLPVESPHQCVHDLQLCIYRSWTMYSLLVCQWVSALPDLNHTDDLPKAEWVIRVGETLSCKDHCA